VNEKRQPDVEAARAVDPAWMGRAVWAFVILAVLIRLIRYLVNYPIWHDEAFLAVNFWDRGYVDLLRPLDYGQVAPWLFLAVERTAVGWLGYSEAVLRLFPTICSIFSVFLFRRVCCLVLPGKAQVLAMGVFATSVYSIRHGAEIKPYASDLLVALILINLALEWVRSREQGRWWWLMAAMVPFLVPLSYPSVFVAGGIGAALGPRALRSGVRSVRLGCAVYGVVLVASFLAFYAASATFQAEAMTDEYRTGCWAESFPPLDRPWAIPLWLIDIHSGTMMAYPAGDRHGGSALTLLCVIAGCVALYRWRQRLALGVLVAPFGLGLLAAGMGRYPYGGAPRITQYLAPSICLLAGLGLAVLLEKLGRQETRRRTSSVVLAGFVALGLGLMVRDLGWPYRVESDVRTREFARRFWSDPSPEGDLVCLKSDFGLSFSRRQWSVGMSAVYLHHQRMFSPRHRGREVTPRTSLVQNRQQPLRLVVFDHLPDDLAAFHAWLGGLTRVFDLRRTEEFLIQPGKPKEDWLRDAYVVLELVPKLSLEARRTRSGLLVR